MNVIGLDLSTKRTGLAHAGRLVSFTPRSIPSPMTPTKAARRRHWIKTEIFAELRRFPPRPDVAMIENYSLGSPGRMSLVALGELGGVIRDYLFELEIPFVLVTPSELKQYATGNGSASKEQMIAAARDLGYDPANDDEADAALLRHVGMLKAGDVDPGNHAGHRLALVHALKDWPA